MFRQVELKFGRSESVQVGYPQIFPCNSNIFNISRKVKAIK